MKVVIFCGGLGLRMGETSARVPKPMIPVGDRPMLWHIMKYYASFGHSEFVLCLGHRGDVIEEYFNDVPALRRERQRRAVLVDHLCRHRAGHGHWPATQGRGAAHRRRRRLPCTYGDGLTDAPLPRLIDTLLASDKIGVFLAAHPTAVFHIVTFDEENVVRSLVDITKSGMWQNAGFFAFRREIFDYIEEAEDLVDQPLHRLMAEEKLIAYPYEGFWEPMDTLKDKYRLDALAASGRPPWQVWDHADERQRALAQRRLMLTLRLDAAVGDAPTVLAVGAHSDDIEIGCAGTILRLAELAPRRARPLGRAQRDRRARRGGEGKRRDLLSSFASSTVVVEEFRDGFLPYHGAAVKDLFEALKNEVSPDLILTHQRNDLHQDHRLVCELTWNTFRDHLILEYEVPKYDGDFGSPNVFVEISDDLAERKLRTLREHFSSQHGKRWFTDDVFQAVLRLGVWNRALRRGSPKASTAGRSCSSRP